MGALLLLKRLANLEEIGHGIKMMTDARTRGRKPNRMDEACPELEALYQKLVIERGKTQCVGALDPISPNWGVSPPGGGGCSVLLRRSMPLAVRMSVMA
jgi:hypothetical protein